jgi:four helix bundle protein
MKSFKELEVWQRAVQMAASVYRITERFPPSERYVLTPQIRKAAVSVPANIAEGWGRGSAKEYIQFLLDARGSLMELLSHFAVAHELACVQQTNFEQIETRIEDVGKMPNGLISSLRAQHSTPTPQSQFPNPESQVPNPFPGRQP